MNHLFPQQIYNAPNQAELDEELIQAVKGFDVDRVARALENGGDPNAKPITDNPNGDRALHFAVGKAPLVTVELLIRAGADIHATNKAGNTPLHLAANFGSQDASECLLTFGADPNQKNKTGSTPMHYAAGSTVDNGSDSSLFKMLCAGGDLKIENNEGQNVPKLAAMISEHCAEGVGEAVDQLGSAIRPAFLPEGELKREELFNFDAKDWELTPKNIGFWNHFDEIVDKLAAQGKPFTHDDIAWRGYENTEGRVGLLEQAGLFFQLPKTLKAMARHGVYLQPEDVLIDKGQAHFYVTELERNGALGLLFAADNWKGASADEIRSVYHALESAYGDEVKEQVGNFHSLLTHASRQDAALTRER